MLPLVPAMLGKLEAELALYQRILTYWPQFGPSLEYGICAALRDTVSATSRQCGLVQVPASWHTTLLSDAACETVPAVSPLSCRQKGDCPGQAVLRACSAAEAGRLTPSAFIGPACF